MNDHSFSSITSSVRIFVSSTFKDMHTERDVLVKRVFPELKKRFGSRQINLVEIDLRWGITKGEVDEGRLLPICLAEIDRCRPFFLCILGDRYGWIPENMPESLCHEHSWLREYDRASITEIEIRYALMKQEILQPIIGFYIRKNSFDPEQQITRDIDGSQAENDETTAKLRGLKEDIKESGFPVYEYETINEFERTVLNDLTRTIDAYLPKEIDTHPLAHESQMHMVFASNASKALVPLPGLSERISNHVIASDSPLVVTGEIGCGKSALLSAWYKANQTQKEIRLSRWVSLWRRKQNPQYLYEYNPKFGWYEPLYLLGHFIGATSASTDWQSVVYRLAHELVRLCQLNIEIPTSSQGLRSVFARTLIEANNKARIVILLDGIDHLEPSPRGELELGWLPENIPPRIRLIISTSSATQLKTLKSRNWQQLSIPKLDESQREKLSTQYLEAFGKRLESKQLANLKRNEACSNPLYLRTCIEELRIFGIYEQLTHKIDRHLSAKDIKSLFHIVFDRCEKDFDTDIPGLVPKCLAFLSLSRVGIAESELQEILGSENDPLPNIYLSPLLLSLSATLIERSGQLNFSHPYAREAAIERYLDNQNTRTERIHSLVRWLSDHASLDRKIQELPWLLIEMKDWTRLSTLLANLTFVNRAYTNARLDLLHWWREIENNSAYRAVDIYMPILTSTKNFDESIGILALIFRDMNQLKEAVILGYKLIDNYRLIGNKAELESWLERQSISLRNTGRYQEALNLLREMEGLLLNRMDRTDALLRCLGNQAVLLRDMGLFVESMALHIREENLSKVIGDERSRAYSLLNQANLLRELERLQDAKALLVETEKLFSRTCDWFGVQQTLGGLANVACSYCRYHEARKLSERQRDICQQLGDPSAMQQNLLSLANILQFDENFDGAAEVLSEHEKLCKANADLAGLARGKASIAFMYHNTNSLSEARIAAKESIRLALASGDNKLKLELENKLKQLFSANSVD